MKLEICHPNEFLNNGWKFVEEVGEDWIDHIRSPSFEWYNGLLARVEDYTGIFNHTECVDVGADSEIANTIRQLEPYYGSYFTEGKSFPDAWRSSKSPQQMIAGVRCFMRQEQFLPAALTCIEHAAKHYLYPLSGSPLMFTTIEAMRMHLQGLPSTMATCLYEIRAFLPSLSSVNDHRKIYNALLSVFATLEHRSSATTILYSLGQIGGRVSIQIERDKTICDILRKEIPFHEIAEALVR